MKKFLASVIAVSVLMSGAAAFAADTEYPEYSWNCAMTVNESTINYMMVEKFA